MALLALLLPVPAFGKALPEGPIVIHATKVDLLSPIQKILVGDVGAAMGRL